MILTMAILFKQYNMGLSLALVERVVSTILNHLNPKKIIIYGSRARGDFRQTSDIDIAVECDGDNREIGVLNEILNEDIPSLLKYEIINLKKVNKRLRDEVMREGIVIYEKT